MDYKEITDELAVARELDAIADELMIVLGNKDPIAIRLYRLALRLRTFAALRPI